MVGRGRRKREMKKIEDRYALQVTFSKRKQGIFNKASELATLCGADVAVVLFSPAGNPYVFAQPSLDAVIISCSSSLLHHRSSTTASSVHRKQRVQQLLDERAHLLARIETERARSREERKRPVEGLSLSEFQTLESFAEWVQDQEEAELWPVEGLSRSELPTLDASAEWVKDQTEVAHWEGLSLSEFQPLGSSAEWVKDQTAETARWDGPVDGLSLSELQTLESSAVDAPKPQEKFSAVVDEMERLGYAGEEFDMDGFLADEMAGLGYEGDEFEIDAFFAT
ncbi:Agamous-like MADS-box protein AGL62 [Acorus calamus]|uniref:Agamous-like MADS-box protein AGL62 n=1 Tax=Acorus calamus TaxID=4465 RepID=A0AAV9DH96_ACOCL|nr:Agamous-like MADS-box protein AGL62 [Acorus calamus]